MGRRGGAAAAPPFSHAKEPRSVLTKPQEAGICCVVRHRRMPLVRWLPAIHGFFALLPFLNQCRAVRERGWTLRRIGMRIGNIMRQTGRLGLAVAVVAGVTLAVEKPAQA